MASRKESKQLRKYLKNLGAVSEGLANHGEIWLLPNGRRYMLSVKLTDHGVQNAKAAIKRCLNGRPDTRSGF
jgi:hypothetical protein